MNKNRRKELERALDSLSEAKDIADQARSEEDDAWENLPDSIREGERGEAMQEAMSLLEDAVSNMEEAFGNIQQAQDCTLYQYTQFDKMKIGRKEDK